MEHQACPWSHLALVQGAEEQSQVLLTPLKQIDAQIICCSEEVAMIPFAEILHLNQSLPAQEMCRSTFVTSAAVTDLQFALQHGTDAVQGQQSFTGAEQEWFP